MNQHWRRVGQQGLLSLALFAASSVMAQPLTYNEAPSLTAQVAAGELPPVEERLPTNPLVVEPIERTGVYGGTWHTALVGGADAAWLHRTLSYENLLRWDPTWTEIIPGTAEAVESNDNATEYTVRLREGLRWSDGHPFTADDIMFWYEDVFLNKELNPTQSGLLFGSELATVESLDDYTVMFKFAAPNGLFIKQLADRNGELPTRYPRHYFEQFHIKYNPEGVEVLVAEAGLEDWTQLFQYRGSAPPMWDSAYWQNADLPTLNAWRLSNGYGDGIRVVAERNPYYWKVDPEGNQLPYIDRVVFDQIDDREVLLLRVLTGDIDMMSRHFNTPANKAVLIDNMEVGNYRLFDLQPEDMNTAVIALNLTHNDSVKREIFQNKDFRIGLSHAIDRQEIIDLIFVGQGEPWQTGPRRESPFYSERLAKQFTEYDVSLANEYLDRAGYSKRDAEGFRLGPDGQRISFVVETMDAFGTGWPDIVELLQGYWQVVGIDMRPRVIDRSLAEVRRSANEHDALIWTGRGGFDMMTDLVWYVPNFAGVRWESWRFNPQGIESEEPPAAVKQQYELHTQISATADPGEQAKLMHEILDIAADQFYVIGISLPGPGYGIVKNNFHNVPELMPSSGNAYHEPAPTNPSQYFIEGEARP